MEAAKIYEPIQEIQKEKQKKSSIYQIVWRWHFYAGIIFAPFLLILAFSGAVYLFKPQIENKMYQDLYFVQEAGSSTLPPSDQISNVQKAYPNGTVTAITFYEPARTTEIGVMENGQMFSVFVNPYNGEIAGALNDEDKLTEQFKRLHSELMVGGTVANRLVELAASWAVILLITGLYIWWPRNRASVWGVVLPRMKVNERTFWRDMHAVPAFWLSIFILILIVTGLPWSGVMGEQINRIATSTNTGYPPFAFSWGEKPESAIKTKDIAKDIPWAAENIPVPASAKGVNGYMPILPDDVEYIAHRENIQKPYTISMPEGEKGVYTLSTSHSKPWNDATLHIDQYSGNVLTDVRFQDYGVTAKVITVGIALHEGRLFGLANQLIGFAVCIGLIGLIISAFIMWKIRKPASRLGAPAKPKDKKIIRTVFFIMLGLGVIMPLAGISIIVVFLLDRFVITKIKPLKAWAG